MQGSTAIQVVTALAPHVPKLMNYVRGRTWLSPPFAMGLFAELIGREAAAPENESASRTDVVSCLFWMRSYVRSPSSFSCVASGGARAVQGGRRVLQEREVHT